MGRCSLRHQGSRGQQYAHPRRMGRARNLDRRAHLGDHRGADRHRACESHERAQEHPHNRSSITPPDGGESWTGRICYSAWRWASCLGFSPSRPGWSGSTGGVEADSLGLPPLLTTWTIVMVPAGRLGRGEGRFSQVSISSLSWTGSWIFSEFSLYWRCSRTGPGWRQGFDMFLDRPPSRSWRAGWSGGPSLNGFRDLRGDP